MDEPPASGLQHGTEELHTAAAYVPASARRPRVDNSFIVVLRRI
jgi:hypothetical protein